MELEIKIDLGKTKTFASLFNKKPIFTGKAEEKNQTTNLSFDRNDFRNENRSERNDFSSEIRLPSTEQPIICGQDNPAKGVWSKPPTISNLSTNNNNQHERNVDHMRLSVERNEVRWKNPITMTHDINSLAHIIHNLKEKINIKATERISADFCNEDNQRMHKFQKKFMELRDDWNILVDLILVEVGKLDTMCITDDFFGFKEILSHYFLNIALSYIIIGPETSCGPGIDNLQTNKIINNNKPTIRQKIKAFLVKLEPVMNNISKEYEKNKILDKQHSQHLHTMENTNALIQTLKSTIKIQEKEILTQKDKDTMKAMQENLKKNKQSLVKAFDQQKITEKEIETAITNKKYNKEKINKEFYSLSLYLHFSYFLHDDWCCSLDHGLLPSKSHDNRKKLF